MSGPLHRPMKWNWWLSKPSYFMFMVREITAVFTGAYVLLTLCWVRALSQGPEAYATFMNCLNTPIAVKFHLVTLIFVLYHTYTWFALTPKVMVIQRGEKTVPGILLILGNYAAMLGASIFVALVILKG